MTISPLIATPSAATLDADGADAGVSTLNTTQVMVDASQLQWAAATLAVRERLRRWPRAADPRAATRLLLDVEIGADGVSLHTPDGAAGVRVGAAAGMSTDTAAVAQGALRCQLDARRIEDAIEMLTAGQSADLALRLVVEDGVARLERDESVARSSRRDVARAIAAAADTPPVGERVGHMPLVLAWAIRASALPADERADDALLVRPLQAARDDLGNRAFELWVKDLPQWTMAIHEALDDAPALRETLAPFADARLAQPFTPADWDTLALLGLAAGVIEGRDRIPATLRSGTPVVALAQVLGGEAGSFDVLPSEAARATALAANPVLRALGPVVDRQDTAERARVVAWLHERVPTIGETEAQWVTRLAAGEVREVNASFTARLASVPLAVLHAALLAHGHPAAETRLADADPDGQVLAQRLANSWPVPAEQSPIRGIVDDMHQVAAERAAADGRMPRLQAQQRRQATQRSGRPADVDTFFPLAQRDESGVRSVELEAQTIRAARVQPVWPGGANGQQELLLPPSPVALLAAEYDVPVVIHLPTNTVVVPGSSVAVVWTPSANTGQPAARKLLERLRDLSETHATEGAARLPPEFIALRPDEVLFARAITGAAAGVNAARDPGAGLPVRVVRDGPEYVMRLGPAATLRLPAERFDDGYNAVADITRSLYLAAGRTPQGAELFGMTAPASFDDAGVDQLLDATLRARALRERIGLEDVEHAFVEEGRPVRVALTIDPSKHHAALRAVGPRGRYLREVQEHDAAAASTVGQGDIFGGTSVTKPVHADVDAAVFGDALETARMSSAPGTTTFLRAAPDAHGALVARGRLLMVVREPDAPTTAELRAARQRRVLGQNAPTVEARALTQGTRWVPAATSDRPSPVIAVAGRVDL